MHIETNPGVIQSWIRAKQTNEQEMLKRLNLVFNRRHVLDRVRMVVLSALEQMRHEMRTQPGSRAQRAMMKENGLAVWQTLPHPTVLVDGRLDGMICRLEAAVGVDANDLSELMRVIGTWLEMGGGFGAGDINLALRTGVGSIPSSAPHGAGTAVAQQKAIDDRVWSKAVRQRENRGEPGHEIEPHVRSAWVPPKFQSQCGLQMFRVNRNDLCKRIDLLFGLLWGATISGTTTDTVLVLEGFGAELGLHAGYYLFPVATIAANLHHTLLEAGLALTVCGALESYCVGFYSTLRPKGGLPPELADVEDILEAAERDPRNRRFIVWYEGANERDPAGCILWNQPWEIQASRRLVEAKGLLTHIQHVRTPPSRSDVAALIDLMAPRLLAALPQEFQPARFRSRG